MSRRRACTVVGSPIAHSLSPVLHTAAYADLSLDWIYTRREVPAGELAGFVDRVGRDGLEGLPCGGISVTMPGKAEALALADVRDERADALGAANTLVPSYDGERIAAWTAYNTDVDGIVGALAEHDVLDARPRHCRIVGAGGTCAAAIAALQRLGAEQVEVVARNHEKAQSVVAVGERLGIDVRLVDWASGVADAAIADLLISTVPPGVADALSGLRPRQVVLDAVYAGGSTALLDATRAAGAIAVDGVLMLLHQAVEQVRLMTGRTPSVAAMRAALEAAGR